MGIDVNVVGLSMKMDVRETMKTTIDNDSGDGMGCVSKK